MFGKQFFHYKFDIVKGNVKVKPYFKEVKKYFILKYQHISFYSRIFIYTKICQNRYRQNVSCEQFISGRGYSIQILHLSRADLGAECFLFCMLESNTKSMHVATAKLTFWRRSFKKVLHLEMTFMLFVQTDWHPLTSSRLFLLQPDFHSGAGQVVTLLCMSTTYWIRHSLHPLLNISHICWISD